MAKPRPWRAIAYRKDWTAPRGRRRVVVGRISACTRDGLDPWIERQRAQGYAIDIIDTTARIELPEPPPPDHGEVAAMDTEDTPLI